MTLDQRLATAGAERRAAEESRLFHARHLREVVREANRKGWPKTRIAETAGISRQTVHEMLKD